MAIQPKTSSSSETVMAVMRDRDIPPKALSLQATRKLLERCCDDADVAVDGEYLEPHGGRRGLGHEFYAEQAELAQEVLRHQNISTTHESYCEVRAAERKEAAEAAVFDNSRSSEDSSPP